jgi:thiol-disulfide isomerase/thioredoxin
MKKILATLALGLGLTSCQAQTEFSKESLTAKLINSENQGITFEEILKQNQGKTVVIEVWASWCSDCVKSMPQVKKLKEKYVNYILNFIHLQRDRKILILRELYSIKYFVRWKISFYNV